MAINVIVQYNGWFLPDILLLTQAPIFVWFDGTVIVYCIITTLLTKYCIIVFCFVMFGGPAWRLNASVKYDGGLLPDIILLTQGYTM